MFYHTEHKGRVRCVGGDMVIFLICSKVRLRLQRTDWSKFLNPDLPIKKLFTIRLKSKIFEMFFQLFLGLAMLLIKSLQKYKYKFKTNQKIENLEYFGKNIFN